MQRTLDATSVWDMPCCVSVTPPHVPAWVGQTPICGGSGTEHTNCSTNTRHTRTHIPGKGRGLGAMMQLALILLLTSGVEVDSGT